jgi:hypothetical protein
VAPKTPRMNVRCARSASFVDAPIVGYMCSFLSKCVVCVLNQKASGQGLRKVAKVGRGAGQGAQRKEQQSRSNRVLRLSFEFPPYSSHKISILTPRKKKIE